jgi:hypothetical protein
MLKRLNDSSGEQTTIGPTACEVAHRAGTTSDASKFLIKNDKKRLPLRFEFKGILVEKELKKGSNENCIIN